LLAWRSTWKADHPLFGSTMLPLAPWMPSWYGIG